MHAQRLSRLRQLTQAQEFDALALNPGPSLFYLTGLSFHLMERPVVGIFSPTLDPILILPELERPRAENSPLPLRLYSYSEDEDSRRQAFRDALQDGGLTESRIGLEPLRVRLLEYHYLELGAPQARFEPAGQILQAVRINKDEQEIEAMRKAVEIAETAFKATLPTIKIGQTERQIANELTIQLLRAGSEPELPFEAIVAAGSNSALPHHTPGSRKIRSGDLIIIDWGARWNGYVSDITRTLAVGDISPRLRQIHGHVLEANQAGRAASKPASQTNTIDAAARQVIDQAGFGEYFIHRTGHGIGLEAHEAPYISQEDTTSLEAGMAYTVEPGIYLPEKGGVRIEDNVVITDQGHLCLTSLDRALYEIK
jgi:Xaa-Pro dipeptidase